MREKFFVDESFINLNAGTQSLCPRSTLEALTRYQREYEQNPTRMMRQAWLRLWDVHLAMGRFFNGDPSSFFLRSNVTQALNEAIFGFPLMPADEIMVSNLEYGAIANICRLRAQRENRELRTFELPLRRQGDPDAPEPQMIVETILKQLRPRTKMLVLSHVLTGTGQIMPLEALARETRQRGIFLIVDGAQAPGAIPVDFSVLENVDAYGGNLHKWMMGPKGTGFGWVPQRHHGTLQTRGGGWNSFENMEPPSGFGDGSRFPVEFLLQGCQDFAPFVALEDTFSFWDHFTSKTIRRQLAMLQEITLKQAQEQLGFLLLSANLPSPLLSQGSSPLLSFALPDRHATTPPAQLREGIYERCKVQVATPSVQGRTVLRLSPHIYNLGEEIRLGIQRLREYFH